MRVALTGSTGFVGRYVLRELLADGLAVRACVRRPELSPPPACEVVRIDRWDAATDWRGCVTDASVVLHAAGAAHSNPAGDPVREAEFRAMNVGVSVALARAALATGVRRFVFVSSIGVNGSFTSTVPFRSSDPPAPVDFYATTKLEAERELREVCAGSAMQLVIVRPTLVAGAGAPGNFARLASLIGKGFPVPVLGGAGRRQLIGVRSLARLLVRACTRPAAADRVLLAADDPPLTIREIAGEIATGLGRKARFVRIPLAVAKPLASLLGRGRDISRLTESLLIDTAATHEILDWQTPVPIQEELRALGAAAAGVGRQPRAST